MPEVMLSSSKYMVCVVFPATVEALGLIVTLVPAINVIELLPSAATAKFITSPTYGDDKFATMSAALGSAIVSADIDVSNRKRVY